ncbi:hypothetical protein [Microbispora sp. H11081]|nr:hypothetical protein [Microbispora sp. H11081]
MVTPVRAVRPASYVPAPPWGEAGSLHAAAWPCSLAAGDIRTG